MNYKLNYILLTLLFSTTIFAQFSAKDINSLSNNELDLIREKIQGDYRKDFVEDNSSVTTGAKKDDVSENITIQSIKNDSQMNDNYFGYSYFNKDINFYDNIPTPPDYKIGPGDEIIISLWGETNSRQSFIINKEGLIYYENIGFINIANRTIEEAEKILVEELARIYSTLDNEDKSTRLKLQLGKLKSMNVYFTGEVNSPGINLIHPFSDIFSAIVQNGGVKKNGSLRKIELIRDKKVINTIDFYSFFIEGKNNFSNLKILDGDIINIPVIKKRIKLVGQVINPGFYELLDKESYDDIISFAGGYTSESGMSITFDQIIPFKNRESDDIAREVKRLSISSNLNNVILNDGDNILVSSIKSVDRSVKVFGRVKNSGSFLITENNSTLKEVLDLAGGFDDPTFVKSIEIDKIVVIRKVVDNILPKEFLLNYNDSNEFLLQRGDNILVYSNSLYIKDQYYEISGEVLNEGRFTYFPGMTVSEAIDKAGGYIDSANKDGLIIYLGSDIEKSPDNILLNISNDTKVIPSSKIVVLEKNPTISVLGNVRNPASFSYNSDFEKITVKDALRNVGGSLKRADYKRTYVKKVNGYIYNPNILQRHFKKLDEGDIVFLPKKEDSDFDITSFVSDISTILMNIAAISVVIDRVSD
tara:strand:- start:797 stop:2731 length:1935 start_codon:yes stop_codon:yes gene_type:complete